MMRLILGVLAGYASWTAIWLGGNAVLFSEAAEVVGKGELYSELGPLVGVIVLSVVCSLVAGAVTSMIARADSKRAVLIMAVLLLLTGIGVQAGVWSLMPAWYHLTFLVLLVPFALIGGRCCGCREPSSA